MNFIRNICNILIKLFTGYERPRTMVDVSKIWPEHFESDDPSEEIPELPREFISEPFYSTMLSDLVETPLYLPAQEPMAGVPLEPPQLVCKAMDTNIPHSGEDTVE